MFLALKGKIIAILALFFASLNVLATPSKPTEFIQQEFDVLHYDVMLDLTNYANLYTNAQEKIKFIWSSDNPQANFYFHLTGLQIDSIIYNNRAVNYDKIYSDAEKDTLYSLSRLQLAGDTIELLVFYHGHLSYFAGNNGWAGVNYKDSILYAMGVGFSNPAVSSTRYWLACYDHPSDKVTFSGRFLVRKGLLVASNGMSERIDLDTAEMFIYRHNFPIATYLLTFAVAPFQLIEHNYKSLPIQIFSEKKDTATSLHYYRHIPKALEFFESIFGDYPFEKVGYVNTPTGSMEHQTMITLDRNIVRNTFKSKDTLSLTAIHELSHQWFGNSITPFDFRDAWLNEAFATYSEALWIEHNQGFAAYLDKISQDIGYYLNASQSEGIFQLYDFPRKTPSSNYPATIYFKGSAVVGLLRYELGDSLFFALLKNYLQSFKHKNISTNEFLQFCEHSGKISLEEFASQWIYSKGYPIITVTFDRPLTNATRQAKVAISQIQPVDYPVFSFPLALNFHTYSGEIIEKIYEINQREHIFQIDSLPPISFVVANRGTRVRVPLKVQYITYTVITENRDDAMIYPNPAYERIHISNSDSIEQLQVSNIFGEILLDIKKPAPSIDISWLAKGIYFVRIQYFNGEYKASKIVLR